MTIKRLTSTEFEFACEGDDDANAAQALTQFEFEGNIYLVKRMLPGIDAGDYKSFFVHVR